MDIPVYLLVYKWIITTDMLFTFLLEPHQYMVGPIIWADIDVWVPIGIGDSQNVHIGLAMIFIACGHERPVFLCVNIRRCLSQRLICILSSSICFDCLISHFLICFFNLILFFIIGYVQSLIRRVVNNVNIVVNNLILKYVEDDIVLSVNITSAECYTVDDLWERAFMDITGE